MWHRGTHNTDAHVLRKIFGMQSGPTLALGFSCRRAEKTMSGVNVIELNFDTSEGKRDAMAGQLPLSTVKTLVKKLLKISHFSDTFEVREPSGHLISPMTDWLDVFLFTKL
jgi:hypothetical protein